MRSPGGPFSTRLKLLAGLLAGVSVAGCGLPLAGGVRAAGQGQGQGGRSEAAGIKVLTPGPELGAGAAALVRGFLTAQISPDGRHAVARQFLTPEAAATWDDASVVIYTAGSAVPQVRPGDPGVVELRLQSTARIAADGAYQLLTAAEQVSVERFRVQPVPGGELRLSEVPAGLLLTSADAARAYASHEIFFLAAPSGDDAGERLVPDRVFLPRSGEPARDLMSTLLRGSSARLRPAVTTAVPADTSLRAISVDGGVVTVDLSGPIRRLDRAARQRLSAQVVWTLQDFTGVRLLVDGVPLDVQGAGTVQAVEDWAAFDPAGNASTAPLYYLQGRKLRVLDGAPVDGDASRPGPVQVDEAAVSPAGPQLGVLTRTSGVDEVRIGGLGGILPAPVFGRRDLSSLSWGSGRSGLWVLERGSDPRLWLLPAPGAAGSTTARQVPYEQPEGMGPLSRFEVSRDGARIAMVFGERTGRRLFVGLVERSPAGLRVTALDPVAPQFENVADVAWESGTSLIVLAMDSSAAGLLTLQVAVDGSRAAPLQRQGLQGQPSAVAAAPGRQLVVAAVDRGEPARLFRDNGVLFRPGAVGSLPFYPG